jgi:hypothetical protein
MKKSLTPSLLYSKAGRTDSYRPGEHTGDKRRQYDDYTSVASKASRSNYSSRVPSGASTAQYRTSNNRPSIQRQESYKPGTIIRAEHFEEAYDGGSTIVNDKSIIRVPGQKPICKKMRFFVVLAAHSLNYICVPVFSHNGNGTRNKHRPEEFVTIRDHRASIEASQQSIHKPLMTKEMSGRELTPESVVHLAYPVSRSYGIPVIGIGRLTTASTSQCIQLFRNYMPVESGEPQPASSNVVTINASMTVSSVLKALQFREQAYHFNGISWGEATALRSSDLEKIGVARHLDRQEILSLFDKVYQARKTGPGWRVEISI